MLFCCCCCVFFFFFGQSLTCNRLHIYERTQVGLQYHLGFVLFMTDVVSVWIPPVTIIGDFVGWWKSDKVVGVLAEVAGRFDRGLRGRETREFVPDWLASVLHAVLFSMPGSRLSQTAEHQCLSPFIMGYFITAVTLKDFIASLFISRVDGWPMAQQAHGDRKRNTVEEQP